MSEAKCQMRSGRGCALCYPVLIIIINGTARWYKSMQKREHPVGVATGRDLLSTFLRPYEARRSLHFLHMHRCPCSSRAVSAVQRPSDLRRGGGPVKSGTSDAGFGLDLRPKPGKKSCAGGGSAFFLLFFAIFILRGWAGLLCAVYAENP